MTIKATGNAKNLEEKLLPAQKSRLADHKIIFSEKFNQLLVIPTALALMDGELIVERFGIQFFGVVIPRQVTGLIGLIRTQRNPPPLL